MSGLPTCTRCKSKHLDIKIDTHLHLIKTCKDCGVKVDPVMDLQHELAICMDALRSAKTFITSYIEDIDEHYLTNEIQDKYDAYLDKVKAFEEVNK